MWAVVGLGNPGRRYANTRHNAGFMVIESIEGGADGPLSFKEYPLYLSAKAQIEGQEAVLVEPITFMNRSGAAVREIMKKYNISPENLIAVHDDIDIEPGRIKIKNGGSSGGHRGIESIIVETGTRDFIRIKIGVGRDPFIDPEDYVLRKFGKDEKPLIGEAVKSAAEAVTVIIKEGLQPAMNRYNKRPKPL